MSRKFYDRIKSFQKKSPIIFAADLLDFNRINSILNCIIKYIGGVKIGLPLLLSFGLNNIGKIIEKYRSQTVFIADLKLADIGFINRVNSEILFKGGFDAVIVHAFIGRDGLLPIVDLAEKMGRGVFTVCAMSHKGGEEFLNKNYERLLEISITSRVDGLILPATYTRYIKYARKMDKRILILSPGIGFQGADIGSALDAGADFEIIGRTIYLSRDPCSTVKHILEKLRRYGYR